MKKPKYLSKLYLDMDGVLTDFDKRYVELFDQKPGEYKNKFSESDEWKQFVEGDHFATLDWFYQGEELLEHLIGIDIPIEILSSSGGTRFHEEITEQKTRWLRNNGIDFPVIVVPGKKHKQTYAMPGVALIDDTIKNVEQFILGGGAGILHINLESTKRILDLVL